MSEGFDMWDLEPGDFWESASGKRVEIMDRAFLAHGKRWVVVHDQDFPDHPVVMKVADFERFTNVT